MRSSIQIPRFGDASVFRDVEEAPLPLPADGARVRVRAAGLNFADLMMRAGLYPEAPPVPFVPGYEVAGEVTEVGSAVKRLRVGDRVAAGTHFGGYTTETVVREPFARAIPAGLSFEEAASIPVNFVTAWMALVEMARVREGDRVVVPSAAGGVGVAAVQMAAQRGAYVLGLVGSEKKAAAVRALGAAEVWTNERWEQASAAEAGTWDAILDATGAASLKRAYARLAPCGRVVTYGASSMVVGERRSLVRAAGFLVGSPFFHPIRLMKDNRGAFGLNVLQLFSDEPLMERAFDGILADFNAEKLKAVVGKTFPLNAAGATEAHRHLQGRGNIGKVVLVAPA